MRKFLAVILSLLLILSIVACTNTEKGDTIADYTPEVNTLTTESGTFTFENGDGDTAVLVSYVGKAMKDDVVEVPAVFNGRKVATIGESAFYQLTSVISVDLPHTITKIESMAFAGCVNLQKITWTNHTDDTDSDGVSELPEGVISIGEFAFYNCSSLTELGLGKSLETIERFAFSNCTSLNNVVLPYTVTYIGDATFQYCSSMTSFDTKNVKKLGSLALYDCVAIESITLSDALESIGAFAFITAEHSLKDKINIDSLSKDSEAYKYYMAMSDTGLEAETSPAESTAAPIEENTTGANEVTTEVAEGTAGAGEATTVTEEYTTLTTEETTVSA